MNLNFALMIINHHDNDDVEITLMMMLMMMVMMMITMMITMMMMMHLAVTAFLGTFDPPCCNSSL